MNVERSTIRVLSDKVQNKEQLMSYVRKHLYNIKFKVFRGAQHLEKLKLSDNNLISIETDRISNIKDNFFTEFDFNYSKLAQSSNLKKSFSNVKEKFSKNTIDATSQISLEPFKAEISNVQKIFKKDSKDSGSIILPKINSKFIFSKR